MVLGCKKLGKKLWTALQILWATIYVICGSIQLVAGIFFLISVKELTLYSILIAGSWNVVVGIFAGMLACIGLRSLLKRQEIFLYLSISVLMVNTTCITLSEWKLYFVDTPKLFNKYINHLLIDCAIFAIRVAAAMVLLVAFLDSQFAFCSMLNSKKSMLRSNGSRIHNPQVDQASSDIEYIIPRSKSSKTPQICDAYAQSWVFEQDTSGPLTKVGKSAKTTKNPLGRPAVVNGASGSTLLVSDVQPVVHVETVSDDGDRKIGHMRSFSRSTSPLVLSDSSSQTSLGNNQQIYACLEKLTEPQIYRSRLNTALSNKSQDDDELQHHPIKRIDNAEPVQYASLIMELQKAIVDKKDVETPPSNPESSHSKISDTEFSKELEAALQLIQDLDSPSAPDTVPQSNPGKSVAMINSTPNQTTTEIVPVKSTFTSNSRGKQGARVFVRMPDSQSTSGYSSPSHAPTPNWSSTSSISGSDKTVTIQNHSHHDQCSSAKRTTVMTVEYPANGKSVTLVRISGENDPLPITKEVEPCHANSVSSHSGVWSVKSLLRKKTSKMRPELESAIVKSESLAYLSEGELLERMRRNEQIQRQIEKRVIQQLGGSKSEWESRC